MTDPFVRDEAIEAIMPHLILALDQGKQYALAMLPSNVTPFMVLYLGEAMVH